VAKKKKDELMKALSDVLRKNLTTDAGTAVLDQIARSMDAGEEEMLTVSVYKKTSEESWIPFATPLHQFEFAPHEYELAVESMSAFDCEEYDVSITLARMSEDALKGIRVAPYFEFISHHAPLDNVLSGTKSEYVGEA